MSHHQHFHISRLFGLCFLFALCISFSVDIQSQHSPTINFQSIDNTNGLPHNFVNAITRDSLGFLWIATNDGLSRYDSPQSIKNFKKGDLGLESSMIRSLCIGSDNSLWVGTRFGGLTKINTSNNSFKTYSNHGEDGKRLSNDEILTICEMNPDEFWVGTENGVNVIDTKTDSIYQLKIFDSEKGEYAKAILNIYKDLDSRLWISTWGGSLYLYLPSVTKDVTKGQFRRVTISDHIGSTNVWKVKQDSEGRYWIATHSGGLYLMQLPAEATDKIGKQEWEPIFHQFVTKFKSSEAISSDYIHDIQEGNNGQLWIATVHGLNIIDREYLVDISKDDYSTDPITLNFRQQYYNPSSNGSLNNNHITTIHKDNQDLIWIGSTSGVNQFNWYTNQFEQFNIKNIAEQDNNQFDLINNIYVINDSIAILASDINGILKYDMSNSSIIKEKPYAVKELHQRITYIHPSKYKHGKLYLGTKKGIATLNQKNNSSKLYPLPSLLRSDNPNIYISCILKDSKNRLWSGTEKGLFLLDEETEVYSIYSYNQNDSTSIADNSITQIYEDSQHNIWFCTYNGLSRLIEGDEVSFETFKRGENNILNNIPSNQITSISEYNNNIYFGTHTGIFSYDLNSKTFDLVKTSNKVYSFQSFKINHKGVLWGSTSDGIISFNLENKDLRLYNKNDGIGDRSFRINSSFIYKETDLYFGGIKGFLKINTSKIKRNTIPPPVYLTEIETINTDKSEIFFATNIRNIELDPNNYYLSIKFSALNYNQPVYNQYAYKLEGFGDEEWKYVGGNQKAIYTNLNPGEYTFRVKASNNEGIWNEEGVSLKIVAKASLYEKNWFRVLLGLALLAIILFVINWYTLSIKKRNQLLNEYNQKLNTQIDIANTAKGGLLERERSMKILLTKLDESNKELVRSNKDLEQFAYVASHDMKEPLRTVGTFTTLFNRRYKNSIDQSGREYLNFITEGVDRMSALINSLLTYSQVGKKDIQFKYANANELIDAKVKDLSNLIHDRNVKLIIEPLPEIYCAPDQLAMIFYNLILNGIKFNKTKIPEIKVSCQENKNNWIFSIKDNGIGIEPKYQKQIFEIFKRLHSKEEYEGTGIGLSLCSKIIHRHNGSIWVESTPEKGSSFYFSISKNIKPSDKDLKSKNASKLNKEVQDILRA